MPLKPYKTLIKEAQEAFIVNKSRFIGHGCPCETEEAALAFLARMRAEYRDATHNCYAYIIGPNMGVMRYSDDGEPGGTAGMPIIEVMKARGVTNAAVVVTRYFGGVLLGAGGLVRAYSQGAAAALNASGVGVMHPTARYLMEVAYPMLSRVDYFLKDAPVRVEDKAFTDVITYTLTVRCADEAGFLARVRDISEGAVEPLRYEELYMAWPEEDAP
ncbi:MAG: YigZ family protein [Clostridia bacterium]|nr:YigZ family protein [Clostridia bacterium]